VSEEGRVPRHVAIIMDGNGRWAKQRGLPRVAGHNAGGDNIRPVAKAFAGRGVGYLTLYAFSTENWSRSRVEVAGLLTLLGRKIDQETQALHEDNVRLLHLGRQDRLPERLRRKVETAVALTSKNTGLTLCLAFDYGGRDEILQAARSIADAGMSGESIDEPALARRLYLPDVPDPDLIIRTGGETRLSNFLLWQAAYSELYFTPVLWPDFGPNDVDDALAEYGRRQRRFGRR
jgi:undecaprenyl diphosphate synthase